jgi:hypothetical protein
MVSDKEASIYDAVPGGADLVRWFAQVPNFHDAEILVLDLRREGQSFCACMDGSTRARLARPDISYSTATPS